MKNILDEIVGYKKIELEERKKKISLKTLKNLIQGLNYPKKLVTFLESIQLPKKGNISLIAEIKLASPSTGVLGDETVIPRRIKEYDQSDIDAISIITDTKFFQGKLEFIQKAHLYSDLPILQKDFVIDPYQIYESKFYEADALLLIARILTEKELIDFVDLAIQLGIEPVVEIYGEADLKKALKTETKIIAVNARNLDDFSIDISKASKLGKTLPKDRIFLGFSGVKSKKEVEQYTKAGAKGVLVGTSIMQSDDTQKFIKSLRSL